jgi:hypothetical protein
LKKKNLEALRYICRLPGGSTPVLIQADDGKTYVIKFRNNLQGPNVLFNEFMGTTLLDACGLLTPGCATIRVSEAFLDANPDCWIDGGQQGMIRPFSGPCFGSRYIGESDGGVLFQLLPEVRFNIIRNRKQFWLAWILDIVGANRDYRQTVFMSGLKGMLSAVFLDNGHYFGGPDGEPAGVFMKARHPDIRIYPEVNSQELLQHRNTIRELNLDQLWRKAHELPDEWITASALRRFARCLDTLEQPIVINLVQNTIVDYVGVKRRNVDGGGRYEDNRESSKESELYTLLYYSLPSGVRETSEAHQQRSALSGRQDRD